MPLFDKQEIKTGLYRGSALLFDNTGFMYSTREMPSSADYEKAQAEDIRNLT